MMEHSASQNIFCRSASFKISKISVSIVLSFFTDIQFKVDQGLVFFWDSVVHLYMMLEFDWLISLFC